MHEMGDRIFYRNIVLFARHGVFEEEERLGQRFQIDLDCYLDMKSYSGSDNFGSAVSYAEIYESVRNLVENRRFKLIEALAEAIAEELLAGFGKLDAVRVEIRKPSAPVAGVFDTVGIEITRRRSEVEQR